MNAKRQATGCRERKKQNRIRSLEENRRELGGKREKLFQGQQRKYRFPEISVIPI